MRDRSWLFVAVLSAVSVVFICTACPNGITDNYPKGPDGSYDLIDDHDPGAGGTWFYIDPVSGSNENDGTSASAALQDFVRLSGRQFGPGDRILVKSGTTLYGTFVARGNGSSAEPVVITGYGGSAKPIVKMRSSDKTGFNLTNVQYWEIRNLEITSEPSDMKDDSNWRVAVLLYNNNGGVLNHLVVDNCYIHDIQTFQPGNGAFFTRFYGGIFVNSGPDPLAGQKPSRFNDVQITNNRVDDCTEAGIYFEAWPMPEVYPKGWYNWNDPGNSDGSHFTMWNTNMQGLTTNLIVSGNTVTRAGGDGMMVGWCDGALIEKNIVADACYNRFSAYAALWTANAHHSVIQYNEIYGTRFNADGMALDDDCFGGDNIYQYNYSHDNEGGFFMTMGQGNNVIVRYNISVNDGSTPNNSPDPHAGGGTRLIQGVIQGMQFYNNIIYTPRSTMGGGSDLINWGWSAAEDYVNMNVTIANNIFYLNGSGGLTWGGGNPEPPIGITFDSNLYWGQAVIQGNFVPPTRDVNRIIADPMFVAAGGFPGPWDPSWNGVDTAKRLFALRQGSPAIGAGARLGHGTNGFTTDFFGNSFGTDRISIGADQTIYSSTPQLNSIVYASPNSVKVRMNTTVADQSLLSLTASVNGGAYQAVPITSVNIDSTAKIAALGFTPLVSGAGYTIAFKALYNGKDPTPVYTLASVDHSDNGMVLKFTDWDSGSAYGSALTEMAFNGSGMTAYTPDGKHDNQYYGTTMWMTADGSPVSDAWIEGGFGTGYLLSAIYIWNYNQVGPNFPNDYDLTNRGLKNVKVEYQDSAGVWHEIPNGTATGYPFTIPKADGSPAMPYSLKIDVTGKGIIAQAIRITADPSAGNGNWGGDHYGLSEIMATGGLQTDYEVYTAPAMGGVLNSDVPGVTAGGSALITITPYSGYRLDAVFVNGVDMTSGVSGGKLAISGINEDKQVSAVFVINQD